MKLRWFGVILGVGGLTALGSAVSFFANPLPHVLPLARVTQETPRAVSLDEALRVEERFRGKAFRTRVVPNWLPDGGLWYRVETGPNREEWVHANGRGEVRRFPTREALEAHLGEGVLSETKLRLGPRPRPGEVGERVDLIVENRSSAPIQIFWVNGDERVPYVKIAPQQLAQQSTYGGHAWEVRTEAGTVLGYVTTPSLGGRLVVDGRVAPPEPRAPAAPRRPIELTVRDHNVWAVPATGEPFPLTTDGDATNTYAGTPIRWSPDGRRAVAFRTHRVPIRQITLVESSPRDQLQPRIKVVDYSKPGDPLPTVRPVLLDPGERRALLIDNRLFAQPWGLEPLDGGGGPGVTWTADSSTFLFAYNQRGHQVMRVVSVAASTGVPRTLFEDTSPTFLHYSGKFWARYRPQDHEILWMSERDGWNHLYVHDARTGAVKRRLTDGPWVVAGVDAYDAAQGRVRLRVMGREAGQDPYHAHYIDVDVRKGTQTRLTDGDGTHRLSFSSNGTTYLATYSRVDLPTVTELRRVRDGRLLATLERADITALVGAGWRPPERFVAKGRDGKTDIWGIVVRPTHFRPDRKYPVIEQIYAGPHSHHVPKAWTATLGTMQQLAELGFVVVMIDGMGTDGRGKAFHDVAYKNLKDAGFPDRIAWLRALGAKDPSLDLSRVGIYGGSAGGQNAMAALLWHGDFYRVAVADCGCHDNRMDKVWWNEQWMGYPVDEAYAASSNTVHAGKLQGRLLLTVGELDTNVDPASTMQVADALIRAGKEFDLIVFPGMGHGAGESDYGRRARMRFFLRHLQGAMP